MGAATNVRDYIEERETAIYMRSYAICFATHVDLHDLETAYTCLSALQSAASAFYFKLATEGRLQLSGGEH